MQQFCLVMGCAILVQAGIQYVRNAWGLPRLVMLLATVGCLVILPAWRVFYSSMILRRLNAERLLFVGASSTVQELAAHMRDDSELGFECLGCVVPGAMDEASECPVLGPLSRLKDLIAELHPDRVVVGLAERRQTLPIYDLLDLRFSGLRIEEVANLYESVLKRVCINELRPAQLIFSSELGPRLRNLKLQRIYSYAIATVGIAVSWPVMLLVAAAIKLSSPGPVLLRQTRVGWRGAEFTV